ncbi:alpha/beta hydrolase [Leptolyngbya sp. FACHB-36]|nr:alpha/beta hydrolase [Leptolyngbya sp. FACHB-36]
MTSAVRSKREPVSLSAITIPASKPPAKGLVVVLHGWGANAQDVRSAASYLKLPDYQLVFPDAPFPYPYAAGGKMWYDFPNNFRFQSTPEFRDRPDLSTSRQRLSEFLQSLVDQTGIPFSRMVLGGFSQGGAMTLDVGFNFPLAGLMVLSGYLHAPLPATLSHRPPVLMVHGKQDTVVPLLAAHQARDSLSALGVKSRYQEYNMGHEISPTVLQQVQSFVEETLIRVS